RLGAHGTRYSDRRAPCRGPAVRLRDRTQPSPVHLRRLESVAMVERAPEGRELTRPLFGAWKLEPANEESPDRQRGGALFGAENAFPSRKEQQLGPTGPRRDVP